MYSLTLMGWWLAYCDGLPRVLEWLAKCQRKGEFFFFFRRFSCSRKSSALQCQFLYVRYHIRTLCGFLYFAQFLSFGMRLLKQVSFPDVVMEWWISVHRNAQIVTVRRTQHAIGLKCKSCSNKFDWLWPDKRRNGKQDLSAEMPRVRASSNQERRIYQD